MNRKDELLNLIETEEEKQVGFYDELTYYEEIVYEEIEEDDENGRIEIEREIDIINNKLSKSISLVEEYKKELESI